MNILDAALDSRYLLEYVTGQNNGWLFLHGSESAEQKEIAAYTTDDGREVLIKQKMRYENKTQINRIEWHYYINGKFNSIQNLDMRMFFPQELDSYLKWNGFNIIHKYGGFGEEAFNDNSEKQVFVCQ